MTDRDLRTLLRELAEDLTAGESAGAGVERAWAEARRRRARARLAVVGSVAAVSVGAAGVATLLPGSDEPSPAPSTQTPRDSTESTSATPTVGEGPLATRAGEYHDAPVWWAPSAVEESRLRPDPHAALPPVIDLNAAEVEPVEEPVLALFAGRDHRAFAVTASGRAVEVDTSRLSPVTDEAGNGRNPLSSYSLSSDGHRAFFVQGSSLEVLDFVTGEWTTIDTPDWLAEGARWLRPDEIWVPASLDETSAGTIYSVDGGTTDADVDWVTGWTGKEGWDDPWGPVVTGRGSTAQAAFLGGPIEGGWLSNPQGLLVERLGRRYVLALDYGGPGQGTRGKGCCLALGWIDSDTVLFQSSGTEGQRVLSWDVGTRHVRMVSEILGPGSIVALVPLS